MDPNVLIILCVYLTQADQIRRFLEHYLLRMAACAAAKRAIGTRNGEQET